METLKKIWNDAFLAVGIPAISMDTSARILAVVYVHGNNEAFVYNNSFLADIDHIKQRFNIYGTGVPDPDLSELIKSYVRELEDFERTHENDMHSGTALFAPRIPQWAVDLFKERYNIKID